jgi:dTDP-4-dehydrorhamnose reductase
LKILVTGCNGQVGWELARVLEPLGDIVAFDRAGLDLALPDRVRATLAQLRPDVIVNAAAYTAVDSAETDPETAFAVNARGSEILAEEAKRNGALLVHYSTDYVFDGRKDRPYVETDGTHPLSTYGRSKLEGEKAIQNVGCRHIILRTAWVYAARGRNFLLTIRRLARERPELRVVNDQFGAPTSAPAIARATGEILSAIARGKGEDGIFHMTAAGRVSWFDFARLIVAQSGPPFPAVLPIPSLDYPTPAARPRNSCLSSSRLATRFAVRLGDWEQEARRILDELRVAAIPDKLSGS